VVLAVVVVVVMACCAVAVVEVVEVEVVAGVDGGAGFLLLLLLLLLLSLSLSLSLPLRVLGERRRGILRIQNIHLNFYDMGGKRDEEQNSMHGCVSIECHHSAMWTTTL
jgi:hypothetical protein